MVCQIEVHAEQKHLPSKVDLPSGLGGTYSSAPQMFSLCIHG